MGTIFQQTNPSHVFNEQRPGTLKRTKSWCKDITDSWIEKIRARKAEKSGSRRFPFDYDSQSDVSSTDWLPVRSSSSPSPNCSEDLTLGSPGEGMPREYNSYSRPWDISQGLTETYPGEGPRREDNSYSYQADYLPVTDMSQRGTGIYRSWYHRDNDAQHRGDTVASRGGISRSFSFSPGDDRVPLSRPDTVTSRKGSSRPPHSGGFRKFSKGNHLQGKSNRIRQRSDSVNEDDGPPPQYSQTVPYGHSFVTESSAAGRTTTPHLGTASYYERPRSRQAQYDSKAAHSTGFYNQSVASDSNHSLLSGARHPWQQTSDDSHWYETLKKGASPVF